MGTEQNSPYLHNLCWKTSVKNDPMESGHYSEPGKSNKDENASIPKLSLGKLRNQLKRQDHQAKKRGHEKIDVTPDLPEKEQVSL